MLQFVILGVALSFVCVMITSESIFYRLCGKSVGTLSVKRCVNKNDIPLQFLDTADEGSLILKADRGVPWITLRNLTKITCHYGSLIEQKERKLVKQR